MHITEVVLDGFKSFGRTTRIPFYEDFTVVTGPNGRVRRNMVGLDVGRPKPLSTST